MICCSVAGPSAQPPDPTRRFNRIKVVEDAASSLIAAAIIGTATGVGWLVLNLPNRLTQLENQITQILRNQDAFGNRFRDLENAVDDHDRRIIRLELR